MKSANCVVRHCPEELLISKWSETDKLLILCCPSDSVHFIPPSLHIPLADHSRIFVGFLGVLDQLAAHLIVVGDFNPLSGHDARQGNANARCAIEPSRRSLASQLSDQFGCKVIAILCKKIVSWAQKVFGYVGNDFVDLVKRENGTTRK
jgi:hypothetical protein